MDSRGSFGKGNKVRIENHNFKYHMDLEPDMIDGLFRN